MKGIIRLLNSSKSLVVGVAVAGIVLLGALGKLPVDEAVEQIKWLVLALVGATAIEDGARKLKGDTVLPSSDLQTDRIPPPPNVPTFPSPVAHLREDYESDGPSAAE